MSTNDMEAIIQARTQCAEEVAELSQYQAFSYQRTESKYGRHDGKPTERAVTLHRTEDELTTADTVGSACARCPIWKEAGECAVREMFHELTREQRESDRRNGEGFGGSAHGMTTNRGRVALSNVAWSGKPDDA